MAFNSGENNGETGVQRRGELPPKRAKEIVECREAASERITERLREEATRAY